MRRTILALFLAALMMPSSAEAQLEPIELDQGATGLALVLRQLAAGASYMEVTAHPDDENNGLLVMLNRGRGLRTALLTVTRGDGGQNEIGPEILDALGILRSAELMAMHRIDGAEQYFTRAYEFGYSFSVEETLEKWGKEEILADVVKIIRTERPDVVTHLPTTGEGGGQHHQTSARLAREAFEAAADPNRFPEQLADGLRPWQVLKMYERFGGMGFGGASEAGAGVVRMNTGVYDPVLGRTYAQMGAEARSMHRCQSMSQMRGLPGEAISFWFLENSVLDSDGTESDIFEGVEMGLDRLLDFVRGEEDAAGFFIEGLAELKSHVVRATEAYDALEPWQTLPGLRDGITTVRELRAAVAASALSDDAKHDLEHRLALKEEQFGRALALAHGVAVETVAEAGEVVPGSTFDVNFVVANQSPEPIGVTGVEVITPAGWSVQNESGSAVGQLGAGERVQSNFAVRVADDADYSRPFWERNYEVDRYDIHDESSLGLPFAPAPVHARLTFRSGDVDVVVEEPVQYRYAGEWVGTEKQQRITVLPTLSVNVSPRVVVYPVGAESREISVEIIYKGDEPAEGSLRLDVPAGWNVTPAQAPLRFARKGEAAVVQFEVAAPADVEVNEFTVDAVATMNGQEYAEGYQTIDYHHIEKRYIFRSSRATVETLDIRVAPVSVGYVMGAGDDVPSAIQQLGLDVTMLDEEALAEGDLSQYDIIVTGVRAYLTRQDLRAYNQRLIDYVEQGGTVLVQYNKFEFNDAQWGPYPIEVGRDRVTVEEAPMRILDPTHPVFTYPNTVTENDWNDWIQERGTYFIGEMDDRYVDLLASEDPWEYNAGEKRGILVETRHGEGRWMYTGLGFFRQLPEGVSDAYKFFANILSLPQAQNRPISQ
ncbi:PIG-L family deacetylase [Gaopeijia maritima]|uniref:PIG-L family deacetylase n=1 Tax=Gaopeijia maritima TaxID=3119007 RepID=A0ABU9E5Q3_9BACT